MDKIPCRNGLCDGFPKCIAYHANPRMNKHITDNEATKCIYIGNLASTVTQEDLVQLFGLDTTPYLRSSCKCELSMDENATSNGCAIVSVPEHISTELMNLNGIEFYGRKLVIEEAKRTYKYFHKDVVIDEVHPVDLLPCPPVTPSPRKNMVRRYPMRRNRQERMSMSEDITTTPKDCQDGILADDINARDLLQALGYPRKQVVSEINPIFSRIGRKVAAESNMDPVEAIFATMQCPSGYKRDCIRKTCLARHIDDPPLTHVNRLNLSKLKRAMTKYPTKTKKYNQISNNSV